MNELFNLIINDIRPKFNSLAHSFKNENKIGKNTKLKITLFVSNDFFPIEKNSLAQFKENIRECCGVSKVDILIDKTIKEYRLEISKCEGVECSRCEKIHDGNGYDFGFIEEFCSEKKRGTKLCIKCIDVLRNFPDHWSYPYLKKIEKDKGWI